MMSGTVVKGVVLLCLVCSAHASIFSGISRFFGYGKSAVGPGSPNSSDTIPPAGNNGSSEPSDGASSGVNNSSDSQTGSGVPVGSGVSGDDSGQSSGSSDSNSRIPEAIPSGSIGAGPAQELIPPAGSSDSALPNANPDLPGNSSSGFASDSSSNSNFNPNARGGFRFQF